MVGKTLGWNGTRTGSIYPGTMHWSVQVGMHQCHSRLRSGYHGGPSCVLLFDD
jgi:hypothetical protein